LRVAIIRGYLNRQLQFRVPPLIGRAALIGDDIHVRMPAAALPDDELPGLYQPGAQLPHPLWGHVQPIRQTLHTQIKGLPGMHIDVLGNVFQQVMGSAPDLRVVAHVQEAFKVHGGPPCPEQRLVSDGR
jgi:hypothetical protein